MTMHLWDSLAKVIIIDVVANAIFNKISVISWRSLLLVETTDLS